MTTEADTVGTTTEIGIATEVETTEIVVETTMIGADTKEGTLLRYPAWIVCVECVSYGI